MRGHHEIVKLLLKDQRVDPSDKRNEAIEFACEYQHYEVVELLLKDKRVNPFDRMACKDGHLNIVELILNGCRKEENRTMMEGLHEASKKGRLEIVRLLLRHVVVDI